MIRSLLAVIAFCFSLNLTADEEDYTAVNGWEDQIMEDRSEDSFDPYSMFNNEEDDNDAEYHQFESPYEDNEYDDEPDADGDDSEPYEDFDESDEQSESVYYEEE